MHRIPRFPHLIGLVLIVSLCPGVLAAAPADLTKAMPADTLVYVGAASLAEEGSPNLHVAKQLQEHLDQQELNEELAFVPPLLDALVALQPGAVGVGLFGVTMQGEAPDIELALVAAAGNGNAKLAADVEKLVSLTRPPGPIQPQEVNGVALKSFTLPNSPFRLLWGVHGEHFLMALGERAAAKVIDCLNGKTPTLADAAELKFTRNKVAAKVDGKYFCVYLDMPRVIATGKEIATGVAGGTWPMLDPFLQELGLTSVRSVYFHADRADGQPRMMAFAHLDGPMSGLLSLWAQQPLTDDDLKVVPKDAYWMKVCNLNLENLWKETLRIVGQFAPDAPPQIEGAIAASAKLLGFSITEDLLPAFGDTWALFDAPEHGGFLLTGTILVTEVKDAAKLEGMIARSLEIVAPLLQETEVTLAAHELKRGAHTIHYFMIGGAPVPVAPAWAFVDNRFVFGLYPQTVATALQQVDPQTRGESILDQPDFKAARARLPQKVIGCTYLDSKYFVRMLYPFLVGAQTMGMSMLAKYGVTLDLDLMPPLPEQAGKVTNYVGTSSVDADGILCASVGDPTPLTMAAGGAALATSVLLPSLERARGQAKQAVSMSNLRGIGMACLIYANDHDDRFPQSFEQLVQAGSVSAQQLRSPFDEEGAVSYVLITRTQPISKERDPARSVLAYERIGDRDRTSVLFVDGHVESVPVARFKELLHDTYRNLGRENEIPPEFRE